MHFFLDIIPPRTTAQEKKVTIVNGRPRFYEPVSLRDARKLLVMSLYSHAPKTPLRGPVALETAWYFARGRSHYDGEWKYTRPDTDNLQKLLKDCMTSVGFWKDDALVVWEQVEKRWSDTPGIWIRVTDLTEEGLSE